MVLLVLCAGCALAHVLGRRLEEAVTSKERARFDAEAVRWRAFLEGQLGNHVRVLQGLRDWFTFEVNMDERAWTNFFYSLNASVYYPAFRGFGYVEHTRPDRLDRHLQAARARLGTNYEVRASLPGARAGHSWYSLPITWYHFNLPRQQPQPPFPAYGQDLNQVPELWAAMNWALGEDRPGVSAPVGLVGEAGASQAVPVFLPVFDRDHDRSLRHEPTPDALAGAHTGEQVEEVYRIAQALVTLRGLAFGLVDFSALFERAVRDFLPDFALRLSLKNQAGSSHVLYDGWARLSAQVLYRGTNSLRYGGRDWILEVAAGSGFDSVSARRAYWLAAGPGGAVSVLVAGFLGSQIHARRKQERAAEALAEARDTLHELLQERQRLGRDLHDKTIQSIYSTRLALSFCRERLAAAEPKLVELLTNCELTLERSIAELRGFIGAREPEREAPVLFADALRAVAEHVRPLFDGSIQLEIDDALAARLGPGPAAELLCIAREAASNSLRHAQARRLEWTFRAEGATTLLRLSDDGRGFDPRAAEAKSGLGLQNINARVEELGGELRLVSQPGAGTTLEVRMPLPEGTRP